MTGNTVDVSCSAIIGLPPSAVDPNAINRFVVGEDPAPRQLNTAEAAAELGDPFATLLLLQRKFPRTGVEVLAELKAGAPQGDPLGTARFFLLGEGSQIPFTPQTASLNRNLRFVASTGPSGDLGPDVLVSTFEPDKPDVELMAWDRVSGGFN